MQRNAKQLSTMHLSPKCFATICCLVAAVKLTKSNDSYYLFNLNNYQHYLSDNNSALANKESRVVDDNDLAMGELDFDDSSNYPVNFSLLAALQELRQVEEFNLDFFNLAARRAFANVLCRSYVLKIGQNVLKVSNRPHGSCRTCCPVKRNKDIKFIAFRRARPAAGRIMAMPHRPGNAKKSGISSGLKTVIFIHGFSESAPGPSSLTVKNSYFVRNLDVNFVILDWSELAVFPWYSDAVDNLKFVSTALVNFLETYHDSGEIPLNNVHLIGFSLGAQIAAFAGKNLRSDLKIPRITALDPAFPMFSLDDPGKRLAKTDAEYVDVIHTDGGVLGFPLSIGHADFYPNGGRSVQPGCQPSEPNNFLNRMLACNHLRSWKYYSESVRRPSSFPATKCQEWWRTSIDKTCDFAVAAYMGYPANPKIVGDFYLVTKSAYPFSMKAEEQKRWHP